jgi:hypothetical protein
VKTIREVKLGGARDPFELRGSPEFTRLEAAVWAELRDEFRAGAA